MAEAVIAIPGFGNPIGYEKLTISTVVKTLTASVYESLLTALDDSIGANQTGPIGLTGNVVTKVRPRVAVIQNYLSGAGADLRYGWPNAVTTAAGAGGGMLLLNGQTLIIQGHGKIQDFRMVRDAAVDTTVTVTYYQ